MIVKRKLKLHHKILIGCAAVLVLAGGVVATKNVPFVPSPIPTATSSATLVSTPITTGCDPTLWNHIYHPARLQVIEACKTVSGTVEVIRQEADSDNHILVKLDSGYPEIISNPVWQGNINKQHGDLIVETICTTGKVTQADAISACQGFNQSFSAIQVGNHVKIIGAFVNDTQHSWLELHPISSVEALP